jgi:hypothetical protein
MLNPFNAPDDQPSVLKEAVTKTESIVVNESATQTAQVEQPAAPFQMDSDTPAEKIDAGSTPANVFCEYIDPPPLREAGAYERKSVSFINALWLVDESVRNLPPDDVRKILDGIRLGLMLERFDYNPLSARIVGRFIRKAGEIDFAAVDSLPLKKKPRVPGAKKKFVDIIRDKISGSQGTDAILDTMASVMTSTLVPEIMRVLERTRDDRAVKLLTEQQKNSFITDKAKELGITSVELRRVMNSAYVFVPLIRNYSLKKDDDGLLECAYELGIIWFRIITKNNVTKAVPVLSTWTSTSGYAKPGRRYVTAKGFLKSEDFAFQSALNNGARNLLCATQAIPEFRLSAQVQEKSGTRVGFSLNKSDGIKVDDKYQIAEFTENDDGTVSQKNNGWVCVRHVADSADEAKKMSSAKIIGGRPSVGVVLSEYPRVPIDINLSFMWSTYKIDSVDAGAGAFGYNIEAMYNVGRVMKIPQLFLGFSIGNGWGSADGAISYYSYLMGDLSVPLSRAECSYLDFALLKKFYAGRFVFFLRPAFRIETVTVFDEDDTKYENRAGCFNPRGGFEIAASPALNLRFEGGYKISGEATEDNFTVNHSGLTIGVGFVYSPPSLPFDPFDYLRAKVGF